MPVYTDQTNRTVTLGDIPRRIISLVPSQTELLYQLGLDTEVVGITKFCVHPAGWFRSKTRVGGTKQLHAEIIHQLQPDLIIANKEENVKEQVEALFPHYPVWTSDVHDLPSALQMIRAIGAITTREPEAISLAQSIGQAFSGLPQLPLIPAAYLIWRAPYMTVGGDTFIHQLLRYAGFANVFADRLRYPEVTVATLQQSGCKVLLLSSEPYPFRQQHIDELQLQLPGVRILLVDGELFSWYGSRLLLAPAYFSILQEQLAGLR